VTVVHRPIGPFGHQGNVWPQHGAEVRRAFGFVEGLDGWCLVALVVVTVLERGVVGNWGEASASGESPIGRDERKRATAG